MRISWSIPKALDKGFQRLLRPRRVPQGNIIWYEKWYELHPLPGVLPTNTTPKSVKPRLLYAYTVSDNQNMSIDEDTSAWLGCPTPLEMYKHQCALLEDELTTTQQLLSKARANIAGLVQMNDLLATGKASAEAALREALERISAEPRNVSFRPIDLVTGQRDHLFRENQRLLIELTALKEPSA